MSHVSKIIAVKQALITQGITDPKVQIDICRTAYVRALSTFRYESGISDEYLGNWNNFILGYWNETYPVAGQLVIADMNRFSNALLKGLRSLGTLDELEIDVAPCPSAPEDLDIVKIPGYCDIVEQLLGEARHKYIEFKDNYIG